MKNRIHKFITTEKEICISRLNKRFQNYIENELATALTKIVKKQSPLTMKEKAVLSLPRVSDGKIRRSQDEILKKYSELIFPKYEEGFKEWCSSILQEALQETETRLHNSLAFLTSIPDLENKIQQRNIGINYILLEPPTVVSYISDYDLRYEAFHFHIVSRMELTAAFNIYIYPQIRVSVNVYLTHLLQKIGSFFDSLEKNVLEIIDEQKESEPN